MSPEKKAIESLEDAITLEHQANDIRENGEYEAALEMYADLLSFYSAQELQRRASEIHAAISLTYRLIFKALSDSGRTPSSDNLVRLHINLSLTRAAQADQHGDKTAYAMAYFSIANYFELTADYDKAVENFQLALDWIQNAPPPEHDREAVKLSFRVKLELAKLFQSNGANFKDVVAAINALEQESGIDAAYNIPVWVSGAYLRLAEFFKDSDKQKAREFLARAKEIIFSNDQLKIRRHDYARVASELQPL